MKNKPQYSSCALDITLSYSVLKVFPYNSKNQAHLFQKVTHAISKISRKD